MTTRTTSKTMTFFHPFKLTGMESDQPAGRYAVETDEELLENLSFPAYLRTGTYLTLPRRENGVISSETMRVDPAELQVNLNKGLETAMSKAATADVREPTFAELLEGSTVLQAISSARLTPDEFKAQFGDLQARRRSRKALADVDQRHAWKALQTWADDGGAVDDKDDSGSIRRRKRAIPRSSPMQQSQEPRHRGRSTVESLQ